MGADPPPRMLKKPLAGRALALSLWLQPNLWRGLPLAAFFLPGRQGPAIVKPQSVKPLPHHPTSPADSFAERLKSGQPGPVSSNAVARRTPTKPQVVTAPPGPVRCRAVGWGGGLRGGQLSEWFFLLCVCEVINLSRFFHFCIFFAFFFIFPFFLYLVPFVADRASLFAQHKLKFSRARVFAKGFTKQNDPLIACLIRQVFCISSWKIGMKPREKSPGIIKQAETTIKYLWHFWGRFNFLIFIFDLIKFWGCLRRFKVFKGFFHFKKHTSWSLPTAAGNRLGQHKLPQKESFFFSLKRKRKWELPTTPQIFWPFSGRFWGRFFRVLALESKTFVRD